MSTLIATNGCSAKRVAALHVAHDRQAVDHVGERRRGDERAVRLAGDERHAQAQPGGGPHEAVHGAQLDRIDEVGRRVALVGRAEPAQRRRGVFESAGRAGHAVGRGGTSSTRSRSADARAATWSPAHSSASSHSADLPSRNVRTRSVTGPNGAARQRSHVKRTIWIGLRTDAARSRARAGPASARRADFDVPGAAREAGRNQPRAVGLVERCRGVPRVRPRGR